MNRETRRTCIKKPFSRGIRGASLRMDGDNNPVAIEGYAAVFYNTANRGTEYWIYDDYVERIQPGAFDRAIAENHDVLADFNHNGDIVLGRTSGQLEISINETGLFYSMPYDADDRDHQNVAQKLKRNDVTGSSFTFSMAASEWEDIRIDDKLVTVRNITDLNLHGVGPVTYPAYQATAAGVRSDLFNESQLVEARSIVAAHRQSRQADQTETIDIDLRFAEVRGRYTDLLHPV